MNINGLRYFINVAQSKSISKAAEQMYITQPALSRHIQRLEKELGVQLFERSRGRISCRLTLMGELCKEDAIQILRYADNMLYKTQTYISGQKGNLNIGYCGNEGYWLYELVKQIKHRCPDVTIQAYNKSVGSLKQGILDGTLDLAYWGITKNDMQERHLAFVILKQGQAQIVVPKGHPFAKRGFAYIYELKEEHFVSWQRDAYPEFHDWFCELCQQHGFTPQIVYLNETQLIYSAIYSGSGLGFFDSAYEHTVDPAYFEAVNLCLDDGSFVYNAPLALIWNYSNHNPCLKPALKIAKESLSQC